MIQRPVKLVMAKSFGVGLNHFIIHAERHGIAGDEVESLSVVALGERTHDNKKRAKHRSVSEIAKEVL